MTTQQDTPLNGALGGLFNQSLLLLNSRLNKIKRVVIHTTATNELESEKTMIAKLLSIFKAKGWRTPGYHFVIKPSGEVVQLVSIAKISNGVAGYNKDSIHIAWIGGDNDGDEPTAAQYDMLYAMTALIVACCADGTRVFGHRDLSPDLNHDGTITSDEWIKVCPRFDVSKHEIGRITRKSVRQLFQDPNSPYRTRVIRSLPAIIY